MREMLAGYRASPALPDEGITFDVRCRTRAGARGRSHPVTVHPDWSLDVPHDLDAERIGVALGGTHTCVELADRTLPAARDVVEHQLRLALPRLERDDSGPWRVVVDAPGCTCEHRTFDTAATAARHLRTITHWARFHAAAPSRIDRVVNALLPTTPIEPPCPLPHRAASGYLDEPDGLDLLWDAGVHPSRVAALVAAISPDGTPVPTQLVLDRAVEPDGSRWLEQFIAFGPMVLAWAARTRTHRDARRPDERRSLIEADLPLPAIAALMTGEGYTLTDIRAYARALGVPEHRAAHTLAAWQTAGVTPTVPQLVALAHEGPVFSGVPPLDAVLRARTHAAEGDWRPSRAEAALAIARTGTVPDAVAHLRAEHHRHRQETA